MTVVLHEPLEMGLLRALSCRYNGRVTGEPETPRSELRLLEIEIACRSRELNELRARAQNRSPWAKLSDAALRLSLVLLGLVGAASVLVLLLYALLVTGIVRMGPG